MHIADVAYFVPAGSALDEEARERGTSVYLVDRVIPMLPRLLCEQLCSLIPGMPQQLFCSLLACHEDVAIRSTWCHVAVYRTGRFKRKGIGGYLGDTVTSMLPPLLCKLFVD